MAQGWEYLRTRLKENSTMKILVTLALGFLGLDLAPQYQDIISGLLIAIISAIGITTKECD